MLGVKVKVACRTQCYEFRLQQLLPQAINVHWLPCSIDHGRHKKRCPNRTVTRADPDRFAELSDSIGMRVATKIFHWLSYELRFFMVGSLSNR